MACNQFTTKTSEITSSTIIYSTPYLALQQTTKETSELHITGSVWEEPTGYQLIPLIKGQ